MSHYVVNTFSDTMPTQLQWSNSPSLSTLQHLYVSLVVLLSFAVSYTCQPGLPMLAKSATLLFHVYMGQIWLVLRACWVNNELTNLQQHRTHAHTSVSIVGCLISV